MVNLFVPSVFYVKMKSKVHQAPPPPHIALMDSRGKIVYKIHVGQLSKDDIAKLLVSLGFYQMADDADQAPKEYQDGTRQLTLNDPSIEKRVEEIESQKKFSHVVERLTPPLPVAEVLSLGDIVLMETYQLVSNFLEELKNTQRIRDEL